MVLLRADLQMLRFIFIFTINTSLFAVEIHQIPLKTFDFQDQENGSPENYMPGIYQIESNGTQLFLRNSSESFIIKLDPNTKAITTMGRTGKGPGEFPGGISGMAVQGNRVWLVHGYPQELISYFQNGRFIRQIKIRNPGVSDSGHTRTFATNGRELLLSVHPASSHLGQHIRLMDDKITFLGELLFDRNQLEVVKKIPAINESMWVNDGEYWYCTFPYYPMIQKYDHNLKLIHAWPIEHKLQQNKFADLLEWEPQAKNNVAIAYIHDLKLFGGHLYVLSGQYLYQLDKESGQLISLSHFKMPSKRDSFRPAFKSFAFLEDGTLFITHYAQLWDHDMWMAENPAFLKTKTTHKPTHSD